MTPIKTEYTGNLGTSTFSPMSESLIFTKAKSLRPTDLLTVSFSYCIATYIDFVAQKNKFEPPNLHVENKKTKKQKI